MLTILWSIGLALTFCLLIELLLSEPQKKTRTLFETHYCGDVILAKRNN